MAHAKSTSTFKSNPNFNSPLQTAKNSRFLQNLTSNSPWNSSSTPKNYQPQITHLNLQSHQLHSIQNQQKSNNTKHNFPSLKKKTNHQHHALNIPTTYELHSNHIQPNELIQYNMQHAKFTTTQCGPPWTTHLHPRSHLCNHHSLHPHSTTNGSPQTEKLTQTSTQERSTHQRFAGGGELLSSQQELPPCLELKSSTSSPNCKLLLRHLATASGDENWAPWASRCRAPATISSSTSVILMSRNSALWVANTQTRHCTQHHHYLPHAYNSVPEIYKIRTLCHFRVKCRFKGVHYTNPTTAKL